MPLRLVAHRDFPATQGGLVHAATVDDTSLLVLVGGGRVPRFAPNKLVIWDEAALDSVGPRTSTARRGSGDSVDNDPSGLQRLASQSPRASTVFSAGSSFDRPGVAVEADERSRGDISDADDPMLRSTHESTVSLGTRSMQSDDERHLSASQPDGMTTSTSSVAESTADRIHGLAAEQSTSAHRLQDSISASSAGLADPFGADETGSGPLSDAALTSSSGIEDKPSLRGIGRGDAEGPREFDRRSASDSHATGCKAATQATSGPASIGKKHSGIDAEQTLRRGRAVAQLEFDEAVRGICVKSFEMPREAGATTNAEPQRTHLIVALLGSKALVFELGAHISSAAAREGGSASSGSWGITQRLSLDLHRSSPALADLSSLPGGTSALLALTGRQAGHVQLVRIPLRPGRASSTGAASIIAAHSAPLATLCLSSDGTMLATASTRGTLIRIWSTLRGGGGGGGTQAPGARLMIDAKLARELRRGTDPAFILSMAFSPDGRHVAAASEKGTLHIWDLASLLLLAPGSRGVRGSAGVVGVSSAARRATSGGGGSGSKSRSGSIGASFPGALSQLASHLPAAVVPQYFNSTWSTAQFRIPLKTFPAQDRAHGGSGRGGGGGGVGGGGLGRRGLQTRAGLGIVGDMASAAAAGVASRTRLPVGKADYSEEDDDTSGTGASTKRPSATAWEEPSPFSAAGASQSTDGAWAAMRARIDDVRRGEAGVVERIFLAWVRAPPPPRESTPPSRAYLGSHTAGGGGSSSKHAMDKSRVETRPKSSVHEGGGGEGGDAHLGGAATAVSPDGAESGSECEYHLLAITTSGGYYRIAPTMDTGTSASSSYSSSSPNRREDAPSASSRHGPDSGAPLGSDTVLRMYRGRGGGSSGGGGDGDGGEGKPSDRQRAAPAEAGRSASPGAAGSRSGGAANGCRLEEFRRFGARDEWLN